MSYINEIAPQAEGAQNVFSASEGVALTADYMHNRQQQQTGITFGTSALDDYLRPLGEADLVAVCGQPSNGKSLILRYLLHQATQGILDRQQAGDPAAAHECTVLITWEESVEQAMAYWLAITSGVSATDMLMGRLTPPQWESLGMAMVQVGSWPLYIIGHSIGRREGRRARPRLTTDAVNQALDWTMNECGVEPRAIGMDYLQRIHSAGGRLDRSEHLLRCVDWAKDVAFWGGCPVLLGTQATRTVGERDIALPGLSDSQWTSNMEQSADTFLSVWMPKTKYPVGHRLKPIGELPAMEVTERLLLMQVAKQKGAQSGRIFPMYVEPEYLRVRDMSTDPIHHAARAATAAPRKGEYDRYAPTPDDDDLIF